MSWLLFLDESGQDHKTCPYEVRGGVAVHASKLWPLVDSLQSLEIECFGCHLHDFGAELKGAKLLKKKRFQHADQAPPIDGALRRKLCQAFLTKTSQQLPPTREELTAYGQASVLMGEGIFERLASHDARLFAAVIPPNLKPSAEHSEGYLRKDHVFLLERFFYFLEEKREHGLLVFDETDRTDDRRFVRRLEAYFTRTHKGRQRTAWIVPSPLFVSSEMSYLIQAADIAIYCVNWGFRVPTHGFDQPTRPEIEARFRYHLERLQYRGEGGDGARVFSVFGITYVPDPYTSRSED